MRSQFYEQSWSPVPTRSWWGSYLQFILGSGLFFRASDATRVTHRSLLSIADVNYPVPDQVIDISELYQTDLGTVFSPGYDYLSAGQSDGSALPPWLSLHYKTQTSVNTAGNAYALALQNDSNILYAALGNSWGIYDVSGSNFVESSNIPVTNARASGIALCDNAPIILLSREQGGMWVYDVSHPSSPNLLSTYFTGNVSEKAQAALCSADGNTIYVAMGSRGVDILDASNKSQLIPVNNFPAGSGYAYGLARSGNILAVAMSSAGTQLLDVSLPRAPQWVSTISSGSDIARAVAISGSTLLAATQTAGTQVVDISNTSSPQLRGMIPTGSDGSAVGVAISGKILLTAEETAGMQILSETTPGNFSTLGVYPSATITWGFALGNDKVFVASDTAGILWLDLRQASLLGSPSPYSLVGQQYDLTVTAYANAGLKLNSDTFRLTLDTLPTWGASGLPVESLLPGSRFVLSLNTDVLFDRAIPCFMQLSLDLANGQKSPSFLNLQLVPSVKGQLQETILGGQPVSVDVLNQNAFIATGNVIGVDISNPSEMTVLNSTASFGIRSIRVANSKSLAYGLADNGLFILNISQPDKPMLVSNVTQNGGQNYALAGSGDYVFVANIPLGVQAIRINNSSQPIVVGTNPVNTSVMAVLDEQIYLWPEGGALEAWNYTTPSNPLLLARNTNSTGFAIKKLEPDSFNHRIFALTTTELQIFDADTLQLRGRFSGDFANAAGLTHTGNLVVIADNEEGTHFIDVTNEAQPQLLASYPTENGFSKDVAILGANAFVAGTTDGLVSLNLRQWQIIANPLPSDVGNYQLRLCGQDPFSAKICTVVTWRIEGSPQINGVFPVQTLWGGQLGTFFLPPGFVRDPNNDIMTFGLHTNNSWFTFNPYSGTFFVTPPDDMVGDVSAVVSVSDGYFAPVNFTVTANIRTLPKIVNVPAPDPLVQGRAFSWTLPPTTFSTTGLSYKASLVGGGPLPYGILFNASTGTFSGTLPQNASEGIINLIVTGSLGTGGDVSVPINFFIHHNSAPEITPISDQIVGVEQDVSFYIPRSCFNDVDNDPLLIFAEFSSTWLNFNSKTLGFSGYTTRADTNPFSPYQFNVKMCAKDPSNAVNCRDFSVTVDGVSNWNLALRYVLGFTGVFSLIATCIKSRAKFYNFKHRKRYDDDMVAYVGEDFESIPLTASATRIAGVAVKLKAPRPDDYRHFSLPGGKRLPHWLGYDEERNRLYSTQKVPPNRGGLDRDDSMVVVVKDNIGRIIGQHRLIRRIPENQSALRHRETNGREPTSHGKMMLRMQPGPFSEEVSTTEAVEMTGVSIDHDPASYAFDMRRSGGKKELDPGTVQSEAHSTYAQVV